MPNFKKFGEFFVIFEFLRQKTGFSDRCICLLRNGWKFLTSFGPPKEPKTPKKCPLCHFFATQEAVLGDFIFGGANGLQIKKFKLSQKVDSPSFPMSYSEPDLDFGKPSKTGLEKVLRIGEKFVSFACLLRISPSFLPI